MQIPIDRPLNIHQSLQKPDASVVNGDYLYFHYLQDGAQDNGWGCAYRSLQTLISHNLLNQPNSKGCASVPTLRQIQEALVSLGDKEPSHIGSSEWLGAIEVCLCMNHFLGVDCKIVHVANRDGLCKPELIEQLRNHFQTKGTPVMIGGDVKAFTILGVAAPPDYDEDSDEAQFLILDPHYTGPDSNTAQILKKGWCGWKSPKSHFPQGLSFYNLCLPTQF